MSGVREPERSRRDTSRSSGRLASSGSGPGPFSSRRRLTTAADDRGPPRDARLHAGRAHGGGRRSGDPGRRGVFVGMRLPLLAFCLARATHGAGGGGAVRERRRCATRPRSVPRDHVGRSPTSTGALWCTEMREVMGLMQAGRVTLGFIGGAQVDRFGKPQHHLRRPAGSDAPPARARAALPDIASLARAPRRHHGARAPAVRGAGRLRDLRGSWRRTVTGGLDRTARRRSVGRHHHARAVPLPRGDAGDGPRERAPRRVPSDRGARRDGWALRLADPWSETRAPSAGTSWP
jgi:hypothetical protein